MQVSRGTAKAKKGVETSLEMARNLLGRLRGKELVRVDVSLEIEGKSVDNIIGRTAHIQMIENVELIRMLVLRYFIDWQTQHLK